MVEGGEFNLVEFKIKFCGFHGRNGLRGEFLTDWLRNWDQNHKEKADKGRFRQFLGDVIEAYEEVADRIGVPLN